MGQEIVIKKANPIRNELKDLRKVLEQTNAVLEHYVALNTDILTALVDKLPDNEKDTNCACSYAKLKRKCKCKKDIEGDTYEKYKGEETGKSFGI